MSTNFLFRLDELSSEESSRLVSEEYSKELDEQDELKEFRQSFHYPPNPHNPEQESLYLCGNSLGLQPVTTRGLINEFLDDWARLGVEGHFLAAKPWVSIDEPLQPLMAEVVGALPEEVSIMNSLTVNMHLMFIPFYRPTESRYKILMEAGAFPSDRYGVESHLRLHNISLEDGLIAMSPRSGENYLRTEDILKTIDDQGDSIALVFFSGIQYYSGQLFEMKEITEAAHKKGCRVGFDLAHAVGNAPLSLHDWGVDFAVWCCYKYLNSGPGNIGGCFVHSSVSGLDKGSNQNDLVRLGGWWSQEQNSRFEMTEEFQPLPGANGFRLSNPPVVCVAALEASLQIFHQAGMDRLRKKSLSLTRYLEVLIDKLCPSGHIQIITPPDPSQRGCQLSLLFSDAKAINAISDRLNSEGVIADIRKPNVMRIAPAPLYNRYHEVWRFVQLLSSVLSSYQKK